MLARFKAWWREAGADRGYLLGGALVFVVAVAVLILLADRAVPGRYLELEGKILRAFRQPHDLSQGIGPVWLPSMVRDITAIGSVAVLTLLVMLVLGLLALKRRWRAAALIFIATVGGSLLESEIKRLADRPRPQVVPHLMEVTSLSFPSGHSMMSSAVYLTLGALLGQTMARRREKAYLIGSALLLTILVGLSRMYLGVHYPTDVLAGWATGVAWALLFWGIAWELQRRGNLRKPGE